MATVAVLPPFPTLFDNAGKPLDAGFVYVGEENQDPVANPIAIFWDAAMTIPAPNPFRTTAGFYSRSGSPGNIFAADNYSMRVCDKGNTQLYVIPSSARVGLGDIVLSSGERLIAEANSLIEVQDGASVFIGTNDGLGVQTVYADNARFVGNLVPADDGTQSVGLAGNRVDVFADAVDAASADIDLFTQMACSANNPVPTTQKDLVSADQNKSKLVGARTATDASQVGTPYNVLSCSNVAGTFTYVLDVGVDDDAEVQVTIDTSLTLVSVIQIPVGYGYVVADGTGKNVKVVTGVLNATTATFFDSPLRHYLSVHGRPRTLI